MTGNAELRSAVAGADIEQLATKTDVTWLRLIVGINLAISLATLTVLGAVWRLLP